MDNRGRGVLCLFALFVAIDFGLGYLRERSIAGGIISIVGGLLSSAFFLWWFWNKKNDDSSS